MTFSFTVRATFHITHNTDILLQRLTHALSTHFNEDLYLRFHAFFPFMCFPDDSTADPKHEADPTV
jgi:hypothetical protein